MLPLEMFYPLSADLEEEGEICMKTVYSYFIPQTVYKVFEKAEENGRIHTYQVDLKSVTSLRPTEEHYPGSALELADHIEREGAWTMPILIEKGSNAILDGHHRYTAAKRLKLVRVPVVAIRYSDPGLDFKMWSEAKVVSKSDVLRAAKTGNLLPAKTTRHILSPPLPLISISIPELRREE